MNEVQNSFKNVKQDFNKVGEWIKHIDGKHVSQSNEIDIIKNQLLDIQNDIFEIKDTISFFNPQISKHVQTPNTKQTAVASVQTVVQTVVQTDVLSNLTVMERGIVWALLNSDMKLSYEDLSSLLGKNKSTIRGQINIIKQKNSNLIMEYREIGGKKRLYIPDEIKKSIVKNIKIRVSHQKSGKKVKSES